MTYSIIGLGEILFDCFEGRAELGGAPTNFAGHVAALGESSALISALGQDELGQKAYEELHRRGVDLSAVVRNDLPTGTVDVKLEDGQPSYTINSPAAWDEITLNEDAIRLLGRADAICFGTLAQRSPASRAAIYEALTHTRADALKLLDVNLRKPFVDDDIIVGSLQLANAMKLNEEEVSVVASAGLAQASSPASRATRTAPGLTRAGSGRTHSPEKNDISRTPPHHGSATPTAAPC